MSRTRRKFVWPVMVVLTLLVVGGCGLLGFTTCHPPDRVLVTVRNIPRDTRFLGLAAQTDRGPVSIVVSPTHLGMPVEMSPDAGLEYFVNGPAPPSLEGCAVRWRFGVRYGVVMLDQKGEWRAKWFPAEDVPLRGRTVFGGGEAEFDLSTAEAVPLDAEAVRALGLQDVAAIVKSIEGR
jgi:hypothetical protein